MLFKDFLEKAPLAKDDLFGEWKQKGIVPGSADAGKTMAEKLSWMRIRVKRALRSKEIAFPADANCKFKRGKVPQCKVGETMVVYAGNGDLLATIVCGGGQFVLNAGRGSAPSKIAAPAKRGRRKGAAAEKENRTPKEIQDATPLELRTSWFNYDLQDAINSRLAEEGVKYWNEHDGKFPKRKIRRK